MAQSWHPRAYQQPMTRHVYAHPRCALWVPMGMGKTVATLSALDVMYICGLHTRPTLVVAPSRVAKNTWPAEATKWDHLRHIEMLPIMGPAQERFHLLYKSLAAGNASVYTINYENLIWLEKTLADTNTAWPFGTVVPDESSKLKGFRMHQGTQRARVLARVAHKSVERIIELSGTPAPNGLKDLWGQLWFLDKGARLGKSFDAFTRRWFRKTYDGFGVEPLPHAQAEIEDLVKDICFSLEAKDYFDLKAPIKNTIYVDLPPAAMKIYKGMEKQMFAEIAGQEVEVFNAAAKSIKCLQIANGAAYTNPDTVRDTSDWVEVHDEKLAALESIIEEAAGAPVLVAYHFRSDLARLHKAFPQGRYFDDKTKTEKDWNAGKIPVMFIHPASGGHGLNLQDGGNIIVFFSHWWNLEEYQQVIERIGPTRQLQSGYDRPVYIHHIVARGTIDELVMQRRETKREVQDLLLEAVKRNK